MQPLVESGDVIPKARPLFQFRPKGLLERFPTKYFVFRKIKFPAPRGRFGIARKKPRGNQEKFTDGLCVTMPVKKYAIIQADGSETRVVASNLASSCVKFAAKVPRILIELTWSTGDNFDIEVIEPDGSRINRNSLKSDNEGRLNRDRNVDACDDARNGREQVIWPLDASKLPLNGKYRLKIIHRGNCGTGRTEWAVAVVINARTVLFRGGKSNAPSSNAGTVVFSGMFMFQRP